MKKPFRMSTRQKITATVIATLALSAAAVLPAAAEGSWSSSVTRGQAGIFQSRWWTDTQADYNRTRVKFTDCTISGQSGVFVAGQEVQLQRDNGIFPDHTHGTIKNACNGVYSQWGSGLPSGSFQWKLLRTGLYSTNTIWTDGYYINIPSLTTQY